MVLDPTAREANIRDSLKRYFVEKLQTAEGIPITFDRGLTAPTIQGTAAEYWVSIMIGPLQRDTLSSLFIDLFCCSRQDNEGFALARLCDTVMGYLNADDTANEVPPKRIPFYQSYPDKDWDLIGALLVVEIKETTVSPPLADDTKARQLSTTIRFASKV